MSETEDAEPPLPPDLQRRKDAAVVDKAAADARQAAAAARKTEIEADAAAATALRDQVKALVPDLTKVEKSTLAREEGTPMWGTFLTFVALPWVADRVAEILVEKAGGSNAVGPILVTSDPDLATADSAYTDVVSGLEQTIAMADALLADLQAEFDALSGGLALAAALPGLLSLVSTQRTVATAATVANDLAATTAVMRRLGTRAANLKLVHDEFRLVPEGAVHQKVKEVGERRVGLVARKLTLADEKSRLDADLAAAKAAQPPDPDTIDDLTRQATDAATRLGLVESMIVAVDTVLAGIRVVPAGAKRSLLAMAALHEALHAGDKRFTHVLLVKGEAGQARETLDNRPLWLEDKFFAIADTSITYMLVETAESTVVVAGTVTRVASASGTIDGPPAVRISRPESHQVPRG